jgi:CBS domain containing-hemolysin-like protein
MSDASTPTSDSAGASYEPRNLPVPVPRPSELARDSEGWFSRTLRALFGWKAGSIRADLKDVLEAGQPADTGFSPAESAMLKNILSLRERRVGDVLIPRADIVAVQQDIPLGELMRVFENAGHSRLVVYNDTLDDPVGMVHIRDLIVFMTARATLSAEKNTKRKKPFPANLDLKAVNLAMPLTAAKLVREILFIPPSMRAIDLLARMQATRIHLALVVDEYGGTDGLISMEDIVEQIVGDIEDEHDEDETPDVLSQPDGSFVADARASLDDVTRVIGSEFDVGDVAEEVDTLGGYLVVKAGRVPVRGELVTGPGLFEIEVLDADPRRVKRVRIYRLKEQRSRPRRESDAVTTTAETAEARKSAETESGTPPKSTPRP